MKATREYFGETLLEMGKRYPDIVVLDADLSKSTKSELFAKAFPHRFFECGIAESNMVGVAAGLALAGKRPFACSFGCFLTGRFEQIRMSVAYNQAPVVLVGSHGGSAIGEDGHSQMALEDIGLMRSLPHMHIFQPTDGVDTPQIIEYLAHHSHYAYLRLTRQKVADVLPKEYRFKPFEGVHLPKTSPPDGADILMCVTGGPTEAALQAALALEKEGIRVSLWVLNHIWPLSKQWFSYVFQPNILGIVTVEDHYSIGGIGTLMAEQFPKNPKPMLRIGLETFGQSGSAEALIRHYGLDTDSIVSKTLAFHGSLESGKHAQEGKVLFPHSP